MKKQSRTDHRRRQSELPPPRHLPLVDLLVDTQAELQELVVASGLTVLEAMLEEDRAAVGGPRYAHQPERQAYRAGTGRGSVGASKTSGSSARPCFSRVTLPSWATSNRSRTSDETCLTSRGRGGNPRGCPSYRVSTGSRPVARVE